VLARNTVFSSGKRSSGSSSSSISGLSGNRRQGRSQLRKVPGFPLNSQHSVGNAAVPERCYQNREHRQKAEPGGEITEKNSVASSLARKMQTDRNRSAARQRDRYSVRRKKKQGSVSEAAKRKASHTSRGSKRGANRDRWIECEAESTTIVRMKTTVVVRSSRERNRLRSPCQAGPPVIG